MKQADPFAARMIESSATAFAGMAATRMLQLDPGLGQRFAPDAFTSWKESLAFRLRDLALALSEGDFDAFGDQVSWARQAFVARDVPLDDLRSSLECMREVLIEELPAPAHASVSACFERARSALEGTRRDAPQQLSTDTPEHRRASRYLSTLLEGDRRAAAADVLSAVKDGELDVRRAILDVLVPAQRELGRMWHMNVIGVAVEHFGTATTRLVIHELVAQAKPTERVDRVAMTAAVSGDAHDIGLSVVAALFELDGWRVVHLGADVPSADLVAAASDFQPDLVALAATLDVHRPELRRVVEQLRDLRARTQAPKGILVGGLSFARDPEAWKQTGADAYSACAGDAVAIGRRLVGLPERLG